MNQFILFQQQKFVRKWELSKYKVNLKIYNEDQISVLSFALSNYLNTTFFEPNGESRYFCILNQTQTPITSLSISIRKKIFENFGLFEFKEEPDCGIFLGVQTEGGCVHEHNDITIDGFYHFRINFLLSKPIRGGMPIINDKEFEINEGESWINLASEWLHKSTPVVGSKPRVVLSLGGLVEKNYLNDILNKNCILL